MNLRITDASRELRYRLGELCERYNVMVADKDTLDVRLGSPAAYQEAMSYLNPEAVYEDESQRVSQALRALIVEINDVAERIRALEGF